MIELSKSIWALAVSCSLLGACDAAVNDNDACIKQLGEAPEQSITSIDLENMIPDLVESMGAKNYWSSIERVPTRCEPPPGFPNQRPTDDGQEGALAPKPVAFVRFGDISGLAFVYLAQGTDEMTEGVAAAIVEYDGSGHPAEVHQLAEFLSFEGHGIIYSSRVSGQSMERCKQEIEYFEYADNGDIIGELAAPRRSSKTCERQAPLH